jgi:hypothetical protein
MRSRSLLLATILLAAPVAARAQATTRDSVLAAIDTFLAGMRTKDTVLMRSVIDSATRMTLLRPAQGGGVRVVTLTGEQFVRVASNPNQPPLDEPIRNTVVQIDADLASVWAEYQVRRDGRVTHCGYDAFHLARLGGRWKILNVSDTYRTTGCGEAWK